MIRNLAAAAVAAVTITVAATSFTTSASAQMLPPPIAKQLLAQNDVRTVTERATLRSSQKSNPGGFKKGFGNKGFGNQFGRGNRFAHNGFRGNRFGGFGKVQALAVGIGIAGALIQAAIDED